jgi:hypothetical protein
MLETAVVGAPQAEESNTVWIEALPARTYHTETYGDVEVNPEHLDRMVQNFKNNVRGQDIAIDFHHGMDRAKGNQAAGWYKDFDIRPSTSDPRVPALFAQVELTDEAQDEIRKKKWRYFSLEWDDVWFDNDGNLFEDVIRGGGLTNRPIAKNIMPINFSEDMWEELTDDERKRFAVWTTKYVNSLPNSAFLYVEAGADKNKSKRHLPYKDKNGKIDLPHLRNAIARIPQMKGISQELKNRLQAKARRLLASASKSMSEEEREAFDLLTAQGFEVFTSESKEWEHSEPGSGNPPEPRLDEESGTEEPDVKEGWRRWTPPDQDIPGSPSGYITNGKRGGNKVSEEVVFAFAERDARELLHFLDLDSDTKPEEVVDLIKKRFSELDEFRKNQDATEQEKQFAERYPQFWDEHNKLMLRDRENSAKSFSESVSKVYRPEGYGLKNTGMVLSPECRAKLEEVHQKFAEGTATMEDFEECVKKITNGGIVQLGEIGSSGDKDNDLPEIDTTSATGIAAARKVFAEVVNKVKTEDGNDKMTEGEAIEEAAKRINLPA